MIKRVAINGFGRIGRMVLRSIIERNEKDIEVVAINDLADIDTNIHLLKYDSVHGVCDISAKIEDNYVTISSKNFSLNPIKMVSEPNPKLLPWKDLDIDIVFECTGRFQDKESALSHVTAGAKKVIVSAPCKGADKTVIMGINHGDIKDSDIVISNGSCTTNCFAPVVSVLDDNFGIKQGYMTTIHAYTGDQKLVDTCHSDMRRARAASLSMIPASTGAARAVFEIFPKLKGKIDGTAIRVPTANVSVIDFTFTTEKEISEELINNAMKKESMGKLSGILAVNEEPLVSIDFNHRSESSIFDATQTAVLNKSMGRVVSWYDNEWGFSNRMVDLAKVAGV